MFPIFLLAKAVMGRLLRRQVVNRDILRHPVSEIPLRQTTTTAVPTRDIRQQTITLPGLKPRPTRSPK